MRQQIAEELRWIQAASDAMSDECATYLRLLQPSDSDPQLRASAAHTLSCCQSQVSLVVREMKQHLAVEPSPLVSARLLLSLSLLLHQNEETSLDLFLL